jgi:hypothetical protein
MLHHNPDFMHTRNFNLTYPLCDALFGTSDLNRGVFGTLFNGMSDAARKPEDQARVDAQSEDRVAANDRRSTTSPRRTRDAEIRQDIA